MNKPVIRKFAIWARNELISRVTQRAHRYGISIEKIESNDIDSVGDKLLTDIEKKQRRALINRINDVGFESVMEEVAYTWFNRFIALRFMEVNGYLPSHVRVFTNQNNNFKPEIMTEAIHISLAGLNLDTVYKYKETNSDDELFKYLIITQCNDLSKVLPGMFQRIADYTELLFPDNLLREGSVIEQMVMLIPEEDWKDQVQIIGWLYQYYNAEPKEKVFAELKKNIKISKEKIPAATQLFTPDWIVRYMVQNSLGRIWIESHPSENLKAKWEFYIDEDEQDDATKQKIECISKRYSAYTPEDIKCIDPCAGSGHICAYMFDVLIQIYGEYGIPAREAASKIVANNIYGIDIDNRATQLAYFSIMMKARQYDRRFFSRGVQPNVFSVIESQSLSQSALDYFCGSNTELRNAIDSLLNDFRESKTFGSLISVQKVDFQTLYERFHELESDINFLNSYIFEVLLPFVKTADILSKKYDIVITNPPYMGSSGMNETMLKYVKENYPDSKNDLYAVFAESCLDRLKQDGIMGIMTSYTWMFLSSYERFRKKLIKNDAIISLIQPEYHAFFQEAFVPICSYIIRKSSLNYNGQYINLSNFLGAGIQGPKTIEAIADSNCSYKYLLHQNELLQIPGAPIAYWLDKHYFDLFKNGTLLQDVALPRQGLATGDNNTFLRYWYEVDFTQIGFGFHDTESFHSSGKLYAPYNKGGAYRKWYGNRDLVIRFNSENYNKLLKQGNHLPSRQLYFKEGINWTALTISNFSCRYTEQGFVFDTKGSSCFTNNNNLLYLMALLNSNIANTVLKVLSPTMDYNCGTVGKIPVIFTDNDQKSVIENLVRKCIGIVKEAWNSKETSYGFKGNALLARQGKIEEILSEYKHHVEKESEELTKHENQINLFFSKIYNVPYSTGNVEEKHFNESLYEVSEKGAVKELISYAVGCMFGRFSLGKEGIIFAGGDWDISQYMTYLPDKDNIIPISDDEYFQDDIVGKFIQFIKVAYGDKCLEENLQYIADVLGGTGTSREVLRRYFINDFYTDHVKMYQKTPIYWLFDSGKKNGFKCLIYMHRYQPDTIARIRTDYVHEQQSRYRTAIADLEQRIESSSTSDRVNLSKKLKHLQEQSAEIHDYEEKIHHLADQYIPIDLDDGVKANYAKFQDVLAKIK